ncbi:hypothetical protein Drorol1_Dr00000987 [Drosera rotundifolia]
MAATISSAIRGFNVRLGEDHDRMARAMAMTAPVRVGMRRKVTVVRPMMKNVNEGKGVFAPMVVLSRNITGKKQFNQIRGKVIALHSEFIESRNRYHYRRIIIGRPTQISR